MERTPDEKYRIGKVYAERLKDKGKERLIHGNNATAKQVGQELGVSRTSVDKYYQFAKGIDALRDVSPAAAGMVLSGKTKVRHTVIRELRRSDREYIKAVAEEILNTGAGKADIGGRTHMIRQIKEEMRGSTATDYTLDMLLDDIKVNARNYIDQLRGTLTERRELLTQGNRVQIDAALILIANDILKVREAL